MKRWSICVLTLALGANLAPAAAQEEKAPSKPFVYASYFECDGTRLGEVDDLMKKMAPLYQKAVADKKLANWGWLRHHTGGVWRRGFYAVGSEAEGLMATMDALADESSKIEGAAAFGAICGSHVDYLWQQASSSPVSATDAPGAVGVSVYYECDFNGEEFADVIVENLLAPVFNAHVGEGKLKSWSWLQHQIGGKFRRLLALRAGDRAALLKTWGEIIDELSDKHGPTLRAFSGICFSHEDYLWLSGS